MQLTILFDNIPELVGTLERVLGEFRAAVARDEMEDALASDRAIIADDDAADG